MTSARSVVRRIYELARNMLRGGRRDADLRADVGSYVDLLTDEKMAAGVPAEEARRAALLEPGSVRAVTEQVREIGLRIALGARRSAVVGSVVRQSMVLAGAGVLIGIPGAAAGSGLMSGLLFGVSARDPVTLIAAAAVLAAGSLVAACIPAFRASRAAPAAILRAGA